MRTREVLLITGFIFQVAPSLWAQLPEFGNPRTATVSSANDLADDSWVVLEGHLIRQVGGDKYLFRDTTGEIVVEIDHEDWRGVTANPETTIRISGEIDRELLSTEIDVETVERVNSRDRAAGISNATELARVRSPPNERWRSRTVAETNEKGRSPLSGIDSAGP